MTARSVIAAISFVLSNACVAANLLPPSSSETFEISFADINGDGLDDAIRKIFATGNLDIWLNSNGSFSASISHTVPNAAAPNGTDWDTWFKDVTGDGLADLIDRNRASGDLVVYAGNGISFASSGTLWHGNGVGGSAWIALMGDVDGDTRADLLGVHRSSGDVFVWSNTGNSFSSSPTVAQSRLLHGTDFTKTALFLQDCDGDHLADLIRLDLESGVFNCFPSQTSMFGETSVRAFGATTMPYEHEIQLAKISPTSPISMLRNNLRLGEIIAVDGHYEGSGEIGPYFGHLASSRLLVGSGGRSFSQAPMAQKQDRVLNVLAWYDIERSPNLGRPNPEDNGWLEEYPGIPGTMSPSALNGPYRSDTPLLGLYASNDPEVLRQHAYWLSSAGVNAIVVDWTNCPSNSTLPAAPNTLEHFCDEIRSATATLLQVWGAIDEFSPPRVTVASRIVGTDYADATLIANDIMAVYSTNPSMWFTFDDGTANGSKPFAIYFSNFTAPWLGGPQWTDNRLNIRYTNGYLESVNLIEADGPDAVKIKDNLPYWFFVEHHPSQFIPGYYRVARSRMAATPSIVEQSIAWTSLFLSFNPTTWDAQNNYINGMSPIQRTAVRQFEQPARNLVLGRFNYPTAWRDEPQEGISTWESSYFEPSQYSGFSVYYDVTRIMWPLTGHRPRKPGQPRITYLDRNGYFSFQSANSPIEYCIAPPGADNCTNWHPIQVTTPNHRYSGGTSGSQIYTRNAFGLSPRGTIK